MYGLKFMCDAFVPLIEPAHGRVINVSDGSRITYLQESCQDRYVNKYSFGRMIESEKQPKLCFNSDFTWEQIVKNVDTNIDLNLDNEPNDWSRIVDNTYEISKAALNLYTMTFANSHPNILVSAVTPGWYSIQQS